MVLNRLLPLFSHCLNITFPPACLLCGGENSVDQAPICLQCWAKANPIRGMICQKCGLPTGMMDRSGFDHPCLCVACRQNKWIFDKARAGFIFDGPVREAIHMMKYQGHFGLGAWLGRKMTEVLQDGIHNDPNEEGAMILPVPLSSDRFREREFNHAFALAKSLGRSWNIPVCPSLLERKPGSKPQVGLTPKERWSNVRGAFKIKDPGLVLKKEIILVDDVFTTGATANECTRELKKAGAIHVRVWTVARTL